MVEIITQLAKLKQLDPNFTLFAASAHQYELDLPIEEDEIARFEAYYRCRLPHEYREFIRTVGNGGAGPHYGLFPLGMQDDGHKLCYWDQGQSLIGDLSAPFRHDAAWNLPADYWKQMPDFEAAESDNEEQQLHDAWNAQLARDYFAPSLMDGAIPICHEGCALRNWLVLNGQFAGTVWYDYRADDRGIGPLLSKRGQALSFREWYVTWLETGIEALSSHNP